MFIYSSIEIFRVVSLCCFCFFDMSFGLLKRVRIFGEEFRSIREGETVFDPLEGYNFDFALVAGFDFRMGQGLRFSNYVKGLVFLIQNEYQERNIGVSFSIPSGFFFENPSILQIRWVVFSSISFCTFPPCPVIHLVACSIGTAPVAMAREPVKTKTLFRKIWLLVVPMMDLRALDFSSFRARTGFMVRLWPLAGLDGGGGGRFVGAMLVM